MPAPKIVPVKPLKAWSFSTFSQYCQCPAKVKYSKILKLAEPTNPAMERGNQIHKLAEKYIKGEIGARVPVELKAFAAEFKDLRKKFEKISQSMVIEDSWAMTKAWEETAWNDWNGCWLRLKLDCAYHADDTTLRIRDWKTGKFRAEKNEEYVQQCELYALVALILHDHIERVIPDLVYLDVPCTYPAAGAEPLVYTRADIPKLKKTWEKRVKAMMSDTLFAPKPNNLCGWCHYRKDNGGPCQY